MKVPALPSLDRGVGATSARAVSGGRTQATASASAPSDLSSLQPRALTGELVVRMAAQGAPVDADLVASIRESLARGDYPVDAQKIAAAMMELDLGYPAQGLTHRGLGA